MANPPKDSSTMRLIPVEPVSADRLRQIDALWRRNLCPAKSRDIQKDEPKDKGHEYK